MGVQFGERVAYGTAKNADVERAKRLKSCDSSLEELKARLEKYPWVPMSMLKALRESLEICYKRMENPRRYAQCFVMQALEE